MEKICLVNNYNYGSYLGDCLRSVENQTVKFDRVIVVDDGSTDDSIGIARDICGRNPNWCFIEKSNGGQLSCFNAAISLINATDIVFHLDSDDIYPNDYLENVLPHVDKGTDFLFCETKTFNENESPISSAKLSDAAAVDVAVSSALTRLVKSWVGSPTSALAMRGSLLKEILPYRFEADWVTRADDVLVYGSSIVGARKRYLQSIAVAYRVHGGNNFFGKAVPAAERIRRNIKLERLFNVMSRRAGLNHESSVLDALSELAGISPKLHGRFLIPNKFSIGFSGFLRLARAAKRLL